MALGGPPQRRFWRGFLPAVHAFPVALAKNRFVLLPNGAS